MIYKFIRQLDQGEKRQFRLSLSYRVGDSPFLEIFDCIAKHPAWDEKRVKAKLSSNTRKYYAAYKNQLQDKLIAVLSVNAGKKSPRVQVSQLLTEIEFLYNRKLLDLCKKRIRKAEKLALDYQLKEDLLKIWRWKLLPALNDRYFDIHQINSRLSEQVLMLEKLKNEMECWGLAHRFVALRNNYRKNWDEQAKKELDEFCLSLSQSEVPVVDFQGLINYLNTCSLTNEFLGEQQRAFEFRKEIGDLFENNPEQIRLNPIRFLDMYFNYIISCAKTKQYELGLMACSLMEKSPEIYKFPRSEQVKSRIFEYSNSMRIILLIHSGKLNELKLIERIAKEFTHNKKYIRMFTQMVMVYFFSYYYFISEQYKNTKVWLNELLKMKADDEPEILNSARLFELILHIHLSDFETLESRLRSLKLLFQKRKGLLKVENFLLDLSTLFFKEAGQIDWGKQLKLYRSLKLTDKDQAFLYTFDLEKWLLSKVKGCSFSEELNRKA